jgi:hypothetical protein
MGKLLMIQPQDDARIERLKRRLGIERKVDVVRAGINLLEAHADRLERAARWQRAAGAAAATSRRVNAGFRAHSRLKRG